MAHHARDPRRRPPDEHGAPAAAVCAPWTRRAAARTRTTRSSSAPRAASSPSVTEPPPSATTATSATCPRRSSTTWRCSRGRTARTRSSPASAWSTSSTSSASRRAPPSSTSTSSTGSQHEYVMALARTSTSACFAERLPAGSAPQAAAALAAAFKPSLPPTARCRPSPPPCSSGRGSTPTRGGSLGGARRAARRVPRAAGGGADWLDPDAARDLLAAYRAWGKERGLGARDLLMPLRIALTGREHGPELPFVLAALDARVETLARLDGALDDRRAPSRRRRRPRHRRLRRTTKETRRDPPLQLAHAVPKEEFVPRDEGKVGIYAAVPRSTTSSTSATRVPTSPSPCCAAGCGVAATRSPWSRTSPTSTTRSSPRRTPRARTSAEVAEEFTAAYHDDMGRLGDGAAPRRRAAGDRDDPRDHRPLLPADLVGSRLRGRRQRLLPRAQLRRLRQALRPAHRGARGGRPRRGRARQGGPARLRRLEGGQAGRAVVGEPLGQGPSRLAHRVLGHGPALPRATASTSTAAAATSSSRTTRTRSPRARPPACRSRASGCTTA